MQLFSPLCLEPCVYQLFSVSLYQVNFLLINPLTNTARALSNPVNQVYEDLAVASGGLAIEVTEQLLANATSIISDTSVASLVNTTRLTHSGSFSGDT